MFREEATRNTAGTPADGAMHVAAILRWFEVGGERHRAYFRQTPVGTRELVIGRRDWEAAVGDVQAPLLEDLSEMELTELASRALVRESMS